MAKLLTTTAADTTTLSYRVRDAMGLSQVAFADKIGVSRRTIQGWETGTEPSALAQKELLRLAKRYKIKA